MHVCHFHLVLPQRKLQISLLEIFMSTAETPIASALPSSQDIDKVVTVSLSHALVRLLSEQLYQSPLKAIEELVVNSYDADARECRVFVPLATDDRHFIAIYDDGHGMDYAGLVDLWQIGRSNKRSEEIQRRRRRKQIGKFGIGKLATYTIANQLTYLSKTNQGILAVTINFTAFQDERMENYGIEDNDTNESMVAAEVVHSIAEPIGGSVPSIKPISLQVYRIENWDDFAGKEQLDKVCASVGLEDGEPKAQTWTLAILEDLKDKARAIKQGSLSGFLAK
jgi:hypothetical protein